MSYACLALLNKFTLLKNIALVGVGMWLLPGEHLAPVLRRVDDQGNGRRGSNKRAPRPCNGRLTFGNLLAVGRFVEVEVERILGHPALEAGGRSRASPGSWLPCNYRPMYGRPLPVWPMLPVSISGRYLARFDSVAWNQWLIPSP